MLSFCSLGSHDMFQLKCWLIYRWTCQQTWAFDRRVPSSCSSTGARGDCTADCCSFEA